MTHVAAQLALDVWAPHDGAPHDGAQARGARTRTFHAPLLPLPFAAALEDPLEAEAAPGSLTSTNTLPPSPRATRMSCISAAKDREASHSPDVAAAAAGA
jgi:hypothetical protein